MLLICTFWKMEKAGVEYRQFKTGQKWQQAWVTSTNEKACERVYVNHYQLFGKSAFYGVSKWRVRVRERPQFCDFEGTLPAEMFGGVPVLWSKWPLASILLQAIKTCRQACPPGYLMHFSQGWIPESLVNNNSKLTKLFNICWKLLLLKSIKST